MKHLEDFLASREIKTGGTDLSLWHAVEWWMCANGIF